MDIHTLHIEHAVLLGLYTFLTIVNSWLHRGTKGVNWFPIYNLTAFLASLLVVLRGRIPNSVSIVLGDLFFPIAYLALDRSLTQFFGKRAGQWKIQAILVFASLLALLKYGWLEPDTARRLIFFSMFLALQMALSASLVFRYSKDYLRVSGGLMALVLSSLGLSNIFRFVGIILIGAPKNYLVGNPILAWTLINNSVLQGAITVCFVWMTAASLRHDLEIQAKTDPLTGLLNRRAIEELAERAIAECLEANLPLTAILIDLDNFKNINDTYGHKGGDLTLIYVAQALKQPLRGNELLARIGGDEFVVLLPCTALSKAKEKAEVLRLSLTSCEVIHATQRIRVQASFGIAEIQTVAARDWDHLIMCCDKALYSVKSGGGNLVASH